MCDIEGRAIVELQHDAMVKELERMQLPYTRPCDADPQIRYNAQSLVSVCRSDVGTSSTTVFLVGLVEKHLPHKEILKKELARIGDSVKHEVQTKVRKIPVEPRKCYLKDIPPRAPPSPTFVPVNSGPASIDSQLSRRVTETLTPNIVRKKHYQFSADQIDTPEVQRVIEEHIVKSGETLSQANSPCKLKPFFRISLLIMAQQSLILLK